MDKLKEKMDITVEGDEFRLSNEDIWEKCKNAPKYAKFNKKDGTFSIIPKLEDLEKRLMLLITCSLKDKLGFWSLQHGNFILELPNAFQKIMNSLDDLNFEFRIFEHVFRVTLNYSASHLEIVYAGKYNYYGDAFMYDLGTALYGHEGFFSKCKIARNESFWNDKTDI